jgi:hypothetical protein
MAMLIVQRHIMHIKKMARSKKRGKGAELGLINRLMTAWSKA